MNTKKELQQPNTSFMVGDPNKSIPRLLSKWDVPKKPSDERKIYADVMSKSIGLLHGRVREYIMKNTSTQNDKENEYSQL